MSEADDNQAGALEVRRSWWVPPRFTMRRLAVALLWFSVSFALMLPDYNLLPGNIVGTFILSSVLCVAGASAFGVAVGILYARPVKGAIIGLGAGLLLLAALLGAASVMRLMACVSVPVLH